MGERGRGRGGAGATRCTRWPALLLPPLCTRSVRLQLRGARLLCAAMWGWQSSGRGGMWWAAGSMHNTWGRRALPSNSRKPAPITAPATAQQC